MGITDELYFNWKQVAALYDIWRQMHRRCERASCKDYSNYGGRGIKVCGRWSDFRVFLEDIYLRIGARPLETLPSGLPRFSLDRIDVNGDYGPDNVRWADPDTQAGNRRPTRTFLLSPGDRYGKLVVLREIESVRVVRGNRGGKPGVVSVRRVLMRCDCGAEAVVKVLNLRNGTTSCGCLKREQMREVARARFTHHGGVPGYKLGYGV